MTGIPTDLFRKIADRANDPMRRTYMSGARANARPLDLGAVMGRFAANAPPHAQGLVSMLGNLQQLIGAQAAMGPMMVGPSLGDSGGMFGLEAEQAGPQPLGDAPGEERLAEAERAIGRPLPQEVRQLYAIGDGGFGPGEGLFPLGELVERYRELTGEPYGPKGQDWPANLLPLFLEDPVLVCVDMETARMVAWDPEQIEDEDSDADWERSFKAEAASLEEYLGRWVGAPTFEEENAPGSSHRPRPNFAPGEDPAENVIAYFAARSAEERAEAGLPEVGWEEELRRRHGGY